MSYIAFYRKWRPTNFDEIKGQDSIVTVLRNQVISKRVGHAYIFTGTRGTGKTSAARVFAKAINCENPVNGNPCGKCPSCTRITNGKCLGIFEIDAASNRNIAEVKQIIEGTVYPPTDSKYKVYIIDEAHQIKKEAFDVLLKTIEEPPVYAVFILATTEPHDIPDTIRSRCQQYEFKRISFETIEERIREVAKSEGFLIEDRAVRLIASKAEGGLRDALSLLDQCTFSSFSHEITYKDSLKIIGVVDTSVFSGLLRGLVACSITDCLIVINRVLQQGRELPVFVGDFVWYLRSVLLAKSAVDISGVVETTAENMKLLEVEAKTVSEEQLLQYIRDFSGLLNDMRYSTQKRVLLEMLIIRTCKPSITPDLRSLSERMRTIEDLLENNTLSKAEYHRRLKDLQEEDPPLDMKKRAKDKVLMLPLAKKEELIEIGEAWKDIYTKMPEMYRACLRTSVLSIKPEDGKLVIVFVDDTVLFLCNDDVFVDSLNRSILEVLGRDVEYEIESQTGLESKGFIYPPVSMLREEYGS